MKLKSGSDGWLKSARTLLIFLSFLSATLPAAAVFKADLQSWNFGSTNNWDGGPISGWRELDLIPCRVLFTGGPQSNYVVTINFDHTRGTSRGIENLTGFTPSTNVIINSGPTLSAPAGVDIWTYTLNVTVTNAAPAQIFYTAALSAGSHNFGGASLAMGGVAQLQIQKPAVMLGSPDMAITKIGPAQAKTNQIITYIINYTNKLIAADTATGVQVIDTLPSHVAYVPNSGSKGINVIGNTLTWNLGNLTPGKRGLLTYKVVVTNNIPVTTTFANYVQIFSAQNDANTADNAASVTTTVVVLPTPTVQDDYYYIGKNMPLTVPPPGVLVNDSNALSATLLSAPVNGTLTFNTNGGFAYVPNVGFLGTDIFAYQGFNSSNASGPAVVWVEVTNTCFVLSTFTTITNNTPGLCGAAVNFTLPATTGDCAPFDYSPTNGSFFPIGVSTVTFTNTDGVSNFFQVIVGDTESPTITCPSNMVFSTGAGQCSRSNVTFSVGFNDNCPGATVVQDSGLPSGATYPAGVTTNSFTVTDASGNTASCAFTVTIVDSAPPVITCPSNIVAAASTGACGSNVTFTVSATDACGSVASLISVPASGAAFPIGVTTVTNTATDASGNASVCTFTVTVLDNQPPAITCPPPVSVAASSGTCVATNVNLGAPIVSDNCGAPTVTNNASASFPVGTNFVTWTVVDNSGNTTTCQQAVVVTDNQPPVITCPADVTVAAGAGLCSASGVALSSPSASDNCGPVTVSSNAPVQFNVGTNIVTWIAIDASGNSVSCQQRVIVNDTQPPVFTCPTNMTLAAGPGQCSRSNVTFTVVATDNCSGVSVDSIPASGSTFPIGVTTVTNTATDASGNTSTCTFTVAVLDTELPAITCPAPVSVTVNNGGCSATNVNLGSPTSSDNCGVATVTNSAPASFPVGTNFVTWTVVDNGGNVVTCQQAVIVSDTQPPLINCPADVTVATALGSCAATNVVLVNPAVTDNCGSVTVTNDAPAQFALGTNVVTWTARDASGNTTTCQQRVIVQDSQAPVINCPASIALEADPGQCSRSNVTFTVTASDNCSGVNIVSIPPSGSTFPLGTTTVTNIATDASGNQTICTFSVNTFSVTINDTQPPVISCPSNLVFSASVGQCGRTNVTFVVTATDNCTVTNLTSIPPSGSMFPVGVTTVTNVATDAAGNQALCSFTVTVTDGQAPTITCPANLSIIAPPGTTGTNVTFVVNATDACGITNQQSVPASGSFFATGVTTVTNTATDANGNTSTCTFTITVAVANSVPVANNQSVSTSEDTALPITLTGSDFDGHPLTYILMSGPTNGTLSGFNTNTGALTYTPTTNYTGADGFTFRVNDGFTNSALAAVSITVTPVNDVPLANNQSLTTPEDTVLPITLTGSDVESAALTYILVAGPVSGSLSGFNTNTGALTYTPATNYNGADSLTFRVSDGTNLSAVATVSITVTPVNDAPFANGQSVSSPEDTALPITLTGSDAEGTAVTFVLVGSPANGSLSGFNTNTGALTYQPNTNYNGADSFTFRVSDGTNLSAVATVSITVTPVNDAPLANNQSVTTPEDTALPMTITGSDVEGTPVTFVLVSGPSSGSLSGFNTNTGALTYTPATNYNGADSLTFRVSDGTNLSAVATVSITVTPVNDTPLANNQSVTTPEDTALPITLTGSDAEGAALTYILVAGPANGSLTGFNTNTGALTYQPNTNYNGADSLTFRVSDGTNLSAVATVSITVAPVNDTPFANNQSVTTPEDTARPITLTGSDAEGTPVTYVLVSGPANGSISGFNTNTGALTYQPNTNYNGGDSFTFRTSDGTNTSALATVSITVTPINDAPIANNDFTGTPRNVPVLINVLANDSDVDGNPISLSSQSTTNGTLSVVGTNLFFTPASNYLGQVVLSYTITDGTAFASAFVFVNVTLGTNTPPVANNDAVSIPEDSTLTLDPRGNDIDADGDPFFISAVVATNGAAVVLGGTNVSYLPPINFVGTVTLIYTINDGNGGTASAAITVTVTPVNDAPFANNQSVSTPEDTALPITLSGADVEGSPLTFILVGGPVNGSLATFNTNTGTLTYTPGANYIGSDSFTFRVNDGTTNSAVATVSITVTPVNDAPLASSQSVSTPEDTALPITLTGSDPEGSPLTFILVNGPVNGSLSGLNTNTGALTYTPNTNNTGADSFTFRVNDGTTNSTVATVNITVTPVNDAPFANNQSVSTPEDTALPITLMGSDVEGSPLTFILVSAPANGSLSGFNTNTGALTYTPSPNHNGSDSFTFRVSDGTTNSAVATVSLTVTPVNDAPLANSQSVSIPEDTVLPIALTGSDVEGSPLTFILVNGPVNGSLSSFNTNTGALNYTPNTNYTGADSLTFRASDGTNTSAVATVNITVTPVNDLPVANSQSVSTSEDTALPITLTGSDADGSLLTFVLVTGPANGALSGFNTNTGALTYTPNTNYNGSDSFTFRVSDGTNTSAVATVSITVTPAADEPRAFNQGLTTPEDTALPITLVGSSPDGNPLTYQLISAPTHGAFTGLNTNTGVLTYQPTTNYNGPDAFTFRVSDGFTNSLVATVGITVTPVNDAPIIVNDATNTPSGQPVVVPPLVNDVNPDGGPLTISCAFTTNGTAVISGTNIIFTSASNFVGTVTVTYCATNQTGGSGSASITVSVTPPTNPTFSVVQGTNWLNPQTGLFEQRVTVTNAGVTTASALRLLVGNINSPQGVPRTNVWLYNATGTNVDSRPYVLYNAPLNPGEFVTLTLEFVVPDRRAFTNSLEIVSVLPVASATNSGGGVVIDRSFLDNRVSPARVLIEWTSIPGRTYMVIYSDDNLATWHAATPSVTAANNRTLWYDDGPPKTASAPLSQGSRFYRVILTPLN